MKTVPVLGYWNIRGLAQPIRLMLGYAGVKFEEKLYEIGDGPEYSYEDWYEEKFNLGKRRDACPWFLNNDITAAFP